LLISVKRLLIAPKKVMVVDDEPDIVAASELALKNHGYRAGSFTNPERAVEEVRSNSRAYALVISDIRMPGMNGFDLARNVRGINPGLPLVFMTAFEIHKSEFSSLFPSTSVAELVTKPFTNAQLIGIVRKYAGITERH
jgi:DNA-binding NtrC family response regulator